MTLRLADDSDPRLIDALVKVYEETAGRLKQIVLHPPGLLSAPFNQARAQAQLAQVAAQIKRLKSAVANWTGGAMSDSLQQGLANGEAQLAASGIQVNEHLQGRFDLINHDAARALIQETVHDLNLGADGMGTVARKALVKMAGAGVSVQEANQVLAGRAVIEGQPVQAIRELREKMEAVNGEKTAILCKDGITREYDTGYYAQLIGRTKTREAVVQAKHDEFSAMGLDLVKIVGRISVHFCTAYLGHVYSIGGRSTRYPALDGLPNGGPPFHPQCSKSTAPFIEGLSTLKLQEKASAA